MYKRILVFVLLCAGVCFSSCSSKKEIVDTNDNVVVPDVDKSNVEGKITYDEYLEQNYERQSELSKKMMKDNEKRSKEDTPLRPRKKKFWFNKTEKEKSCTIVDDAVIKDGVRDIK
jgi:hypothetical protein